MRRRVLGCSAGFEVAWWGLSGKGAVWPVMVVQQGLRTPTELSFGSCCTHGIRGLVGSVIEG